MMRKTKYRSLFLSGLLIFFAGIGQAAEISELIKSSQEISKSLRQLNQESRKKSISESKITKISGHLAKMIDQIELMQKELTEKVKSVSGDIATLGEKNANDPPAVKDKRRNLTHQKEQLVKLEKELNVKLLNIKNLKVYLADRIKEVKAKNLFANSDTFYSLLRKKSEEKSGLYKRLSDFVATKINLKSITIKNLSLSMIFLLIIYLLVRVLRWRLLRKELFQTAGGDKHRELSLLLLKNLVIYLPGMMFAVAGFVLLDVTEYDQKLNLLSRFTVVLFATLLILPFLLTMVSGLNIPRNENQSHNSLFRRLKLLVYVTGVGFYLNSLFKESGLEIDTLFVLYDLTLAVILVLYYLTVSHFARHSIFKFAAAIRVFVALFVVSVTAIAFSGYRNLSFFLMSAITGVFILLVVYVLLNKMLSFINKRVVDRTSRFQASPELTILKTARFWLVFLMRIALILGLSYAVLHLLGFHGTLEKQLDVWIYKGFSVGSIGVVPSKILLAILVFAGLQSLTGWVKAKLDTKWLSDIGMERSAKEALVTMSGYIGIIISTLMALGIVGVSFTNLAIIAGALSVGIGFGLQNIVNNFISGLILLFERPIKTGDWIVVGDIEGYVKRISIRSTIIQTFERADVIVPNAELITTKVTNWMYRDRRGRVNVPLGVAYGTNVQQVIELLTQVAEQHDQVITANPMFPVRVIMLNFGDSALEFELRCFISDIDRRAVVKSEINIAVEAALKDAGIEIPFPQRDIHMKDS